jgi:hypothetical protein
MPQSHDTAQHAASALERLGLVWNVKRPRPERIAAKRSTAPQAA